MDPVRLQKQLRDNNNDLMNFCADLKQWGEEMKQKEESVKPVNNSVSIDTPLIQAKPKKQVASKKSNMRTSNTSKSNKTFDYSKWDKYDVEVECAKLDEQKSEGDDSGDLTDECDETAREEALYNKEKGNKFVKKQKWIQAIECYTKAIESYAYDPVFYANRALCYLKISDYRLAESDCTTAIQLDKTYVKAYHRRAQAREALNQLNEARDDILKVFDYEPDNKESKIALTKLEKKLESSIEKVCLKDNNCEQQKPKSKFTLSRQQQKVLPTKSLDISKGSTAIPSNNTIIETSNTTYWPSGNNIELINTVHKVPHLRSKKPLTRITIGDSDLVLPQEVVQKPSIIAQPLPSVTSDNNTIRCDDFKVIERTPEHIATTGKITKNYRKVDQETCTESGNDKDSFNFKVPQTSVQFNYDWKLIKSNSEWKYLYLKQVHPKKFRNIFNESLESDVFSDIIKTLTEEFINRKIPVYDYLIGLTEVKRFNMLTLFMTDSDKQAMRQLVDYMVLENNALVPEVDHLMKLYDL